MLGVITGGTVLEKEDAADVVFESHLKLVEYEIPWRLVLMLHQCIPVFEGAGIGSEFLLLDLH